MFLTFFEYPYLAVGSGFVLGSVIGSFLNVCAYRIPREISVIFPPSSCPGCEKRIPWLLNLPLVSWLLLKGRAKCCDFNIPSRYFVVELASGIIFSFLFYNFTVDAGAELLFLSIVFTSILLVVSVIDAETMLIPDRFSIGGAFLGLILSFFFPILHGYSDNPLKGEMISGFFDSFMGMIISSSFLFWIGAIAERLLRREALGQGDVKLLGCIGAFCGWEGGVFSIFGGAVLGTSLMIPVVIFEKFFSSKKHKNNDQVGWGVEIPFGPFLALAALIYFLFLGEIVDEWFEQTRINFVHLSSVL